MGKIGGTGVRFPLSDPGQQWGSLHRIMELDGNIEVWPGHDYGVRPSSTIAHEIATNPFLLGSYSYWRVGQYTQIAGVEQQPSGSCCFAGEHCSTEFQGFMEGAAAEGARAAREILNSI